MASYALTDGYDVVSLNPEYDMSMPQRKIESVHRTRSGAQYRYTWGTYKTAKLPVEMLSSADMWLINAWWAANTALRLYDMSSTVVVSGYLVGAEAPINQFVKPYHDMYKGVIELEGY